MAKIFSKKETNNQDQVAGMGNGHQSPNQLDPQTEEAQKLNAVRELLFGQHIKEYREEFDELKGLINSQKQDFEKKSVELKQEILNRLEKIEEKFNNRLEDYVKTIKSQLDILKEEKVNRKKLVSILKDLASQLEE